MSVIERWPSHTELSSEVVKYTNVLFGTDVLFGRDEVNSVVS